MVWVSEHSKTDGSLDGNKEGEVDTVGAGDMEGNEEGEVDDNTVGAGDMEGNEEGEVDGNTVGAGDMEGNAGEGQVSPNGIDTSR